MEFAERDAPAHRSVKERIGEEYMVLGGGGGAGGHLQCIQRLWDITGDGDLLLIPGAGNLDGDNKWPAVVRNQLWARELWKRTTIIISKEGAEPQESGFFFKAVVQGVFLFIT